MQVYPGASKDGRVVRTRNGRRASDASPHILRDSSRDRNEGQEYDIDALQSNLLHKVDQWNKRGSNFNIERVSLSLIHI